MNWNNGLNGESTLDRPHVSDWARDLLRLLSLPWYIWLAMALVFGLSLWRLPWGTNDWAMHFGPASRHWWAPWEVSAGLFPWVPVLLAPLGGLPDRWAIAFTNSLIVYTMALYARREYGAPWPALIALTSPFGVYALFLGQLEWLILLGLLVEAPPSLILLLSRPQEGVGVVLLRLWAHRRDLLRYGLPMAAVVGWSFMLWPDWLAHQLAVGRGLSGAYWNMAVAWPWTLPVGLFFLLAGLARKDEIFGLLAGPWLAPFVNLHSFSLSILAVAVRKPRLAAALSLASWAGLAGVWVFVYS